MNSVARRQGRNIICDEHNYVRKTKEVENTDEEHKKLVLEMCGQDRIIKFSEAFPESILSKSEKIGEGTYGEVFSIIRRGKMYALKIIPIEGAVEMNGGPQRSYEQILQEILIHRAVSDLHFGDEFRTCSFVKLNRCWCVQGEYPHKFLQSWMKFRKERGTENRNPRVLPKKQTYLIFECPFSGIPLEAFEFKRNVQIISCFQQVTFSLAVAEKVLRFEHRDLHLSNILIRTTDQKYVQYFMNGIMYHVETFGVTAKIMDFSLSRMTYPLPDCTEDTNVYINMEEDPLLFEGKGDIQFDVYRQMREIVKSDWSCYAPSTNVNWLEYILKKCNSLSNMSYLRKQSDYVDVNKMINKLQRGVESCSSAEEVISLFPKASDRH